MWRGGAGAGADADADADADASADASADAGVVAGVSVGGSVGGSAWMRASACLVRRVQPARRLPRPSMGRGTLLFQKQRRRTAGRAGARIAGAHSIEGSDATLARVALAAAKVASRAGVGAHSASTISPVAPSAGEPSPSPACQRDPLRQERPTRSGGPRRRRRDFEHGVRHCLESRGTQPLRSGGQRDPRRCQTPRISSRLLAPASEAMPRQERPSQSGGPKRRRQAAPI